jgi:hypothetical protein
MTRKESGSSWQIKRSSGDGKMSVSPNAATFESASLKDVAGSLNVLERAAGAGDAWTAIGDPGADVFEEVETAGGVKLGESLKCSVGDATGRCAYQSFGLN